MKYKILLVCTILGACTVGPDYSSPKTDVPQSWLASSSTEEVQLQANWWKHFNDPVLDKLIEKAESSNFDLKIAENRITEARASRQMAKSDLLPQANAKASAQREGNQLQFPGAPASLKKPFSIYQAGFDASWEADIFGGKKRELESTTAELQASESSLNSIKISMLAEVAKNYINIRQYQAQIKLANDTLAADEKTLEINNKLFKAGTSPKLDVIQAQSRVNDTKSQLPKYESMLAQTEYATDVLLAEKPGYTHSLTMEVKPIPLTDKDLILSAPAKVIANRPDIVMAERKLASATAQQGVATAAFYPDISLSGFIGLMNVDGAHLLESGSKSWSLSGGILLPILNYGKLSANLSATDARQQEALTDYQKSVITALSDVESSVTAYQKDEQEHAALASSVEQKEHAAKIADDRYKLGMTSFLEVLDAKRAQYTTQQQLLISTATTSQNIVAVYKSLGGAWEPAAKKQ